jgi:DNA-binding transcriptional regulator YiaG
MRTTSETNASGLEALAARVRRRQALPAPEVRAAIRRASGISALVVAQTVGCDRQSIRNWELGRCDPSPELLGPYIEVLEVLAGAGRGGGGP